MAGDCRKPVSTQTPPPPPPPLPTHSSLCECERRYVCVRACGWVEDCRARACVRPCPSARARRARDKGQRRSARLALSLECVRAAEGGRRESTRVKCKPTAAAKDTRITYNLFRRGAASHQALQIALGVLDSVLRGLCCDDRWAWRDRARAGGETGGGRGREGQEKSVFETWTQKRGLTCGIFDAIESESLGEG